MTTSPSRRMSLAAVVATALAIVVPACGDDDDTSTARPALAAGPALGGDPSPGTLNCSHLANRENNVAVWDASLELARRSRLGSNTRQVATRIYAAMHDLCDQRSVGEYRPAEDAVEAVGRGEYPPEVSLP